MVREIVSIGIGQCGVQLGDQIWQQFHAEHGISTNGDHDNWMKSGPTKQRDDDQSFRVFYQETASGKFIPRNIFIDTQPNATNTVKSGKYAGLYHPEFVLSSNEDAAGNFAAGHYVLGKEMIDIFTDRMRKEVEECDNVQGFIINHSVGGGTGSGLGALILERLAVDYRKKTRIGLEVYSSPTMSPCIVAPYNELLATHWSLDHMGVSVVLDNEAIYELCQRRLDIRRPSLENMNRLITKPFSAITGSFRFENELNVDLKYVQISMFLQIWRQNKTKHIHSEFQTNLVPFPRIHFLISSYAPLTTQRTRYDVQSITESAFWSPNFLVKRADFDAEEDKNMAMSVFYRGDVKAREANATVQWLKTNKKVTVLEWGILYLCS